jgi:SNF2 family DNA or RNA helicase
MYPDRVPMSYLQFRENTQIQVNSHKWIKKNGWREVAFSLLQPGILIRKRDHIKELPPLTFEDYYAPLSTPAKKAYEAIFDDFVYAEVKDGQLSRQVTAINAAAKVTKLLQISGGTVYDDEREVMYVDVASKKSLLTDIAEKTPGKIIVYVPFRPALQVVAEHMRAQGYKTEVVFGDVSKAQRDVIFKAMQDGDLDCIVGQPDSMSHSITLTAASDIVWWGPTPNAETYEQANGRIERLGQTNPMTIHRLYSSNAERRVYELLADKTFSQQSLLELYLDEAQRR